MKITVTRNISTEVKITVNAPAYLEHAGSFFKVLNSEDYIEVTPRWLVNQVEVGIAIKRSSDIVALIVDEGKPTTELTFLSAIQSTIEIVNKLTNSQSIQAVANQTEL